MQDTKIVVENNKNNKLIMPCWDCWCPIPDIIGHSNTCSDITTATYQLLKSTEPYWLLLVCRTIDAMQLRDPKYRDPSCIFKHNTKILGLSIPNRVYQSVCLSVQKVYCGKMAD